MVFPYQVDRRRESAYPFTPYGVLWATIASLNFGVPLFSPIRLRNHSELASELNVSVKFEFVGIQRLSLEQRWSRWVHFLSRQRVIPSSASRKNHRSGTRHLAESTRDVGSADRCESVAGALSRCGFRGASSVTRLKDLSVPRDGSLTKATTKSSSSGDAMSPRQ